MFLFYGIAKLQYWIREEFSVDEFKLTSYQALAVAAIVLFIGQRMIRKVPALDRYCIPAPVMGGIVFSLLNLAAYCSGIGHVTFDNTHQVFFMTLFFCSVGFSASFRLLKVGGVQVIVFLIISVLLVVAQNVIGCGMAAVFGLDAKLGLLMGSVPLVGGHGTAGSFGPLIEEGFGVANATSIALASATFGLVAGSLLGGPVARRRILERNLRPAANADDKPLIEEENIVHHPVSDARFLNAMMLLAVAVGLGTMIYQFFKDAGITFPTYIGAMLLACLIRNLADLSGREVPMVEIDCLGSLSLNMFLGMALMSLRLWQLADLAVPMIVILMTQTAVMGLFAYFVVFGVMGRDYEAACFAAGSCGFGLGATPNAMANIQAVNRSFGPSPRALFVLPLVGSLFIDFFNSIVITGFLNFLK